MKKFKAIFVLLFCFTVFSLQTISALAAEATFSWIPNDPEPTGYKIYFGVESRNYTQIIDVANPDTVDGRIIQTVADLEEGQTYYFAATAYSETEESAYTDEIVHTVPVTTVSTETGEATFSWIPNDPEPDGYKIYYGNESGNYTEVVDIAAPVATDGRITYTINGLLAGQTYYFVATAYSGTEESAYTEEIAYIVPVTTVSDPPIVSDISLQGNEDSFLSGKLPVNDASIVDEYIIRSGPLNGTLTIEDNTGHFTYTPGPHFSGVDSFTFSASNSAGTSETATATLTIVPVNDRPVANNSAISVTEDNPHGGQLTGRDIDGDNLSYTLVNQAANGTAVISSSGSFTYTPNQDYSGSDSFSFMVNDGTADSNTAVVTINISPVNDAPLAASTSISLNEDSSFSGHLTASDVENDSLTYSLVDSTTSGTVNITTSGTFTYTPNQDYSGGDSFSFMVNDGNADSNAATVNIGINSVNDIPVANATSITVDENSSYSGALTANDKDGDPLTFLVVSQPAVGIVNLASSGSFTYTPNQVASGSDAFTFKVNDGSADSGVVMVNVTIQKVNDAPVALSSSFVVDAGEQYSGQLVANDDGIMLTYAVVSAPEKGSLSMSSDGSFTYTANSADSGSDFFTFNVTDESLESAPAIVNITINEVQAELAFEMGELQVTSDWQHVEFTTTFINPSVVAKSTTTNDSESGVVTIRNVSSSGFDIRIQEWDYLDGTHPEEQVSFLAMERGHHQVADGVYAVADCNTITGLNSYTSISYSNPLSTQPVVLSSVVTTNDADAVTLRIKNVDNSGFSVLMQEQEDNDGVHSEETMCFIAWETMSGIVDDLMVEVAVTDMTLTHVPETVSFTQPFTELPLVMAGMQTASGGDTAVVGLSDVSVTGAAMTIVEEQSADSEIGHIEEVGGYFAIAPFNSAEDSDGDGLTNGTEIQIQTHPGLLDTDGDSINDGEEYEYWMNNGYSHDTDNDGDGVGNLLDADSDNDGTVDGIEIAKGYDPADANSSPFSSFELETGEVLVNHETVRVQFEKSFLQPVVIANMVTRKGSDPCVVRISDVTEDGFNIQLQEYGYLDKTHTLETVSYIVMEQGSHTLDDGTRIEAGLFTSNATKTSESVSFTERFTAAPVVLTTINSMNDTETVAGRVQNITTGGFQFRLQEQEANAKDHGLETIAYIAWTPGAGEANGIRFEAGKTTDSVTHNSYNVALSQSFDELPYHFADMQTTDGGDTSTLSIIQSGLTDMDIFVEEECSRDTEINHTKEIAGYLVLSPLM